MALSQPKLEPAKDSSSCPVLKDHGKPFRGFKTQRPLRESQHLLSSKDNQPIRKSPRLRASQRLRQLSHHKQSRPRKAPESPWPPARTNVPLGKNAPRDPIALQDSHRPSRKRRRVQETYPPPPQAQKQAPLKRSRTSPPNSSPKEQAHYEINRERTDPLQYWIENARWDAEYFQQDSQVREDFERGRSSEYSEERDKLQEHGLKEPFESMHGLQRLHHLFARKRSSASLRRKSSGSSLQTPSDQLPREIKSAQYRSVEYELGLERKGSYMCKFKNGCEQGILTDLLYSKQDVPHGLLFDDNYFDKVCDKIRNRNEAMIIQDITRLIVPSAQNLAIFGAESLSQLYECVNEGWNSAIPFHGTRPQPDYSVGFGRSSFTEEQLGKLEPFVGDIVSGSGLTSLFIATTRMYFPFLTCEVKCGAAALDIADRQNAHSMTVAVRGIVELFRAVQRQEEVHRIILAFSVSHDHRSVRIYGHYAAIEGNKTSFYRHPIHTFDFTALDGKERWTAYKFTKKVYDIWAPMQHQRICSAINDLPSDPDFNLSQSASFPQSSQQTDVEDDGQSSFMGSQEGTVTTSFSQANERASKKPRNQRATR